MRALLIMVSLTVGCAAIAETATWMNAATAVVTNAAALAAGDRQ
jgi:hypothetical protein